MAYLADCETSFAQDFAKCTQYYCNYQNLRGQDLSGDSNYPLYSNASNCQSKSTPGRKPQPCKACPIGEPILYDGVPIDYQMESFVQTYQQCETPADIGNQQIKERNLWNEREPPELDERPAYKQCEPSDLTISRQVDKQPVRDGIPNSANNLRDVAVESKLYNIGGLQVFDANQGRKCVDTSVRYNIDPGLAKVYDVTQVNPTLFARQLYTDYDGAKNADRRPVHVFRNYTKSKMRN